MFHFKKGGGENENIEGRKEDASVHVAKPLSGVNQHRSAEMKTELHQAILAKNPSH